MSSGRSGSACFPSRRTSSARDRARRHAGPPRSSSEPVWGGVLELGAGQGRDTLFLAGSGLRVWALDYAEAGVRAIHAKARAAGLSTRVRAVRHDVREPLPFPAASFAACYAHLLFSMAFTGAELERLAGEVRRVLRPGGLCIYTARNKSDPHYGKGLSRGEEMYEVEGVAVHFFRRERVAHLAQGYRIVGIEECEEGTLPRRLFQVTLTREVEPDERAGKQERRWRAGT